MNRTVLAIALMILLFFPIVVLEETSDQSVFEQSTPPDPLLKDLMWIKEEFGNTPKIIVAKGYWPNGVFNAFLGWAMVFLDIDMKSSFVYIGRLIDLLTGKPSGPFIGFPSEEVVILDPLKYHIIILYYEGSWLNFYDPDALELLILKNLRPNVYEVEFNNSSEIAQWCRFWESINAGQMPQGDIGYAESSFINWTAAYGHLNTSENGAKFVLWQNATEGWIEVENLNIDYHSYPYMLLRVNTLGGKINYVDFYNSQDKFIGRGKLYSTTSNWTVFILDLKTLELPDQDSIWRIGIVFESIENSRTFLINKIVFMNIPFSHSQ